MTASYVRLAHLREVSNSVQALRGVPAEMGSFETRPVLFAGVGSELGKGSPFPGIGILKLI